MTMQEKIDKGYKIKRDKDGLPFFGIWNGENWIDEYGIIRYTPLYGFHTKINGA